MQEAVHPPPMRTSTLGWFFLKADRCFLRFTTNPLVAKTKRKHDCNSPSCSARWVRPGMGVPNYTARSHSASANPSRGRAGPRRPSPPHAERPRRGNSPRGTRRQETGTGDGGKQGSERRVLLQQFGSHGSKQNYRRSP